MFITKKELGDLRAMVDGKYGADDLAKAREAYRRQGLSDERYRWDVFWSLGADKYGWVDGVYGRGGHDDHIGTALRKVLG